MRYEIFEGNMERLEKKLLRIYNKCQKYGCSFHYEEAGEIFKTLKDERGKEYTARFVVVEAEGTAVVNDWEFIASVEHTEKGNIFTGKQEMEVPERYYTGAPVCEHCGTSRYRKYTYIVRNKETGEFKQVGKACLKDFTHGMSVEAVAQYISLFDTLIEGQTPYPGSSIERYLPKEEYLLYVAETIRHFGYVKSGSRELATSVRAVDYYDAAHGRAMTKSYLEHLVEEMDSMEFDINHQGTVRLVNDALAWIMGQPEDSNYIHNLKTACSLDYITYKNFGLLASLFPAYGRSPEKKQEHNAAYEAETGSGHVGQVGEYISVKISSGRCMTSWDTEYGLKRLYKFVGTDGNVYIWKTGVSLNELEEGMTLSGTVKAHNEFRGIKQTELTRCKVSR